jgi:hypothetical protein
MPAACRKAIFTCRLRRHGRSCGPAGGRSNPSARTIMLSCCLEIDIFEQIDIEDGNAVTFDFDKFVLT